MKRMLFAALVLGASPAVAQAPASAPPAMATPAAAPHPTAAPDPDAIAAARELMTVMHLEDAFKQSTVQSLAGMGLGGAIGEQLATDARLAAVREQQPKLWADTIQKLGTLQAGLVAKAIGDMGPQIVDYSVRMYAQAFTASELRALTAFYRTPAGQKILTQLPVVMSGTLGYVQAEAGRRMDAQLQAAQPEIAATLAPLVAAAKK